MPFLKSKEILSLIQFFSTFSAIKVCEVFFVYKSRKFNFLFETENKYLYQNVRKICSIQLILIYVMLSMYYICTIYFTLSLPITTFFQFDVRNIYKEYLIFLQIWFT